MSKSMVPVVDPRNEDYRNKLGLSVEQAEYDDSWRRLSEVYAGRVVRPWLVLGLKRKPDRERRHGAVQFVQQPLTKADRFLFPDELDVVSLADVPARVIRKGARHTRFNVMVLRGYTDEVGVPCVGGNDRFCSRQLDFAKPPIQDHPHFNQGLDTERKKLKALRPGSFRVVESDRWIDLCVGVEPDSDQPCVNYRLPNNPDTKSVLELTGQGRVVERGALLATLKDSVLFHTARFDNNGRPFLDKVGADVLSATRLTDLFQLLNRMHRLSTDMTLNKGAQRPNVVPLEDWLPSVCYQFPEHKKPKMKDDVLYAKLCHALGPRGDFGIVSPHRGTIKALTPLVGQEHLSQLEIVEYKDAVDRATAEAAAHAYRDVTGGKAEFVEPVKIETLKTLIVPSACVMRKQVGDSVQRGEHIADYCKRIFFDSWATVEGVLGEELALMVLNDFVERQAIRVGEHGWEGPGRLWPVDLLAEVPVGSRWVWDLLPAFPYLTPEGTIVGPAVKMATWDDLQFSCPFSADFDLRPAFGRLDSAPPPFVPVAKFSETPGEAPHKKRRKRRKKKKVDGTMTDAPVTATAEPKAAAAEVSV